MGRTSKEGEAAVPRLGRAGQGSKRYLPYATADVRLVQRLARFVMMDLIGGDQKTVDHNSLKSSGTSPNFFSTTASENSPTFGSPARLNAMAPALAGSRDIPSARLIAVPSLWHSCASPGAALSSVRMNGRAT